MKAPTYINVFFLILCLIMFSTLLLGLYKGLQKAKNPNPGKWTGIVAVALIAWFALLGILAGSGFLAEFDSLPPRMIFILVPTIIGLIIVSSLKRLKPLVEHVPPHWIAYAQTFRLPLEIILWLLAVEHIIPEDMTFEGKNFDVATSLVAPFIAYFVFQKKQWPKIVGLIWNFGGIALVITIVTIAVLYFPQFHIFSGPLDNRIVATLPFVWLPGFLVPLAIFYHLFSIKQLRRM